MPTELPRILVEIRYYQAAQAYLRKLPPEHFMESTTQSTQRKITVESLDLVHRRRPEVQTFSELLVQYPLPRRKKLGQVVPDNMVVIHSEPIKAKGSYDIPLQPVGPFWVLEYVSPSNRRKDYDDNMRRYERELKVPYYLLFEPDEQELTLFHYRSDRYATVLPDAEGKYAIEELDLAVGILDRWVRFWYRGELLQLPADLEDALDEKKRQLAEMTHRAETEARRAETEARRADVAEQETARLRAELEKLRTRTKSTE